MRYNIYFRKEDNWLIEDIKMTVKVKKMMGINTCDSTEIARLLRRAMVGEDEYIRKLALDLGLFERFTNALEADKLFKEKADDFRERIIGDL